MKRPAMHMGRSITGAREPSRIKREEAKGGESLYSGFPASWSTTPPLLGVLNLWTPPWSSFAQTFATTTGN